MPFPPANIENQPSRSTHNEWQKRHNWNQKLIRSCDSFSPVWSTELNILRAHEKWSLSLELGIGGCHRSSTFFAIHSFVFVCRINADDDNDDVYSIFLWFLRPDSLSLPPPPVPTLFLLLNHYIFLFNSLFIFWCVRLDRVVSLFIQFTSSARWTTNIRYSRQRDNNRCWTISRGSRVLFVVPSERRHAHTQSVLVAERRGDTWRHSSVDHSWHHNK